MQETTGTGVKNDFGWFVPIVLTDIYHKNKKSVAFTERVSLFEDFFFISIFSTELKMFFLKLRKESTVTL